MPDPTPTPAPTIRVAANLCLRCTIALGALTALLTLVWHRISPTSVKSSDSAVEHSPVVIFKLPRSGSSWFTQELNAFSAVFISKEIVQRSDKAAFSNAEMESHFIAAMRAPTGKLSSTRDFLPTGRYVEDYLLHKSLKVLTSLKIVGFSVNPEHCRDVSWRRVAAAVPKTVHAVALVRSNLIKSALSGFRGKQTTEMCGSSNLRWNSNCTLPASVDWSVDEFFSQVDTWQVRYDEFNRFIGGLKGQGLSVQTVYYEDLQRNLKGSMVELFVAAGLGSKDATEIASSRPTLGSQPQTGWLKRSTEDLSKILSGFKAIEAALQERKCTCLLEQLRVTEARVFACSSLEIYDATSRVCSRSVSRII